MKKATALYPRWLVAFELPTYTIPWDAPNIYSHGLSSFNGDLHLGQGLVTEAIDMLDAVAHGGGYLVPGFEA